MDRAQDNQIYRQDVSQWYLQAIIKGVQLQQLNLGQINKSIVLIVYGRPGFRGNCTGFLINQTFLLTCAHFFFFDNPKTKMRQLADINFCYVYPGVSGELEKPYKIQQLAIPKLYDLTDESSERKQLDFAIIKLKQPVPPQDFYFMLDCKCQLGQKQQIHIYGYPKIALKHASKTEPIPDTARQMGSTLKYKRQYAHVKLGSKNLSHYLSTLQGHSGSPFFRVVDGVPFAFAIHKGQMNGKDYNEATLITNKVLKTILRFVEGKGMIKTTKTIHQVWNQAEIQLQIHKSQSNQPQEQRQEGLQNQKEGDKIKKNINPSEQMKQKIQMVTVFRRAQIEEQQKRLSLGINLVQNKGQQQIKVQFNSEQVVVQQQIQQKTGPNFPKQQNQKQAILKTNKQSILEFIQPNQMIQRAEMPVQETQPLLLESQSTKAQKQSQGSLQKKTNNNLTEIIPQKQRYLRKQQLRKQRNVGNIILNVFLVLLTFLTVLAKVKLQILSQKRIIQKYRQLINSQGQGLISDNDIRLSLRFLKKQPQKVPALIQLAREVNSQQQMFRQLGLSIKAAQFIIRMDQTKYFDAINLFQKIQVIKRQRLRISIRLAAGNVYYQLATVSFIYVLLLLLLCQRIELIIKLTKYIQCKGIRLFDIMYFLSTLTLSCGQVKLPFKNEDNIKEQQYMQQGGYKYMIYRCLGVAVYLEFAAYISGQDWYSI